RRRVQITRGVQRILIRGARGIQGHEQGGQERNNTNQAPHGFFLKSTLTRTGALSVTVTACRCSPSSGLRNTISCGPIVSVKLPMRFSPLRCPSTQASAHGSALTATDPVGQFIGIGATRPGGTCTVRTTR